MKLAILGIFFDGYYDLWEDFLEIFRMNWPDCPYPLYIVNQTKELSFDRDYNVTVIHAGKEAEYSRKVQIAIDEIDADYFLLLLEDFFIGDKLDRNVLDQVVKFIENKNVKYYSFSMNLFNKDRYFSFSPELFDSKSEYTVVSGNCIYKKEFLKECIGTANYNAWVYEGIYAKSKTAHTDAFLKGCYKDKGNILHLYHGALQGKFLPHTYKHFNSIGYSFHTNRDMMTKFAGKKVIIKSFIKTTIGNNNLKKLKRLFNYSGVLDRYSSEIDKQIKCLGLDRD